MCVSHDYETLVTRLPVRKLPCRISISVTVARRWSRLGSRCLQALSLDYSRCCHTPQAYHYIFVTTPYPKLLVPSGLGEWDSLASVTRLNGASGFTSLMRDIGRDCGKGTHEDRVWDQISESPWFLCSSTSYSGTLPLSLPIPDIILDFWVCDTEIEGSRITIKVVVSNCWFQTGSRTPNLIKRKTLALNDLWYFMAEHNYGRKICRNCVFRAVFEACETIGNWKYWKMLMHYSHIKMHFEVWKWRF